MIKFTSFLIKRAKNSSVIPYSDFLAIARGKEGKLLDFFLSVKGTGLFELSNEGLKVVATPEELAVFKRETYKISPPFTNFKKYSIFDLNRKAKRFSLLSLRILDYVKNNIGCDLNDLQKQFKSPEFREAHSLLLNEELVACVDGEFFVAIEEREYQLLISNLKNNGITLDEPDKQEGEQNTDLKKYCVKVFGREVYIPLDLGKTPEKLIYDYYMVCDNPQEKVYLREKRAYLLNYPNLLDEKSTFKMVYKEKSYNLKFGTPLKAQIKESFWNAEFYFETEFAFKSFS